MPCLSLRLPISMPVCSSVILHRMNAELQTGYNFRFASITQSSLPVNKIMNIFECKKCGDCCKGYGGTFVTDSDIEAIAAYVKVEPRYFLRDYCQMSGTRPVLAQGKDGYCIFRENKICSIHPVKPRMCRAWPFIQSVLTDISNWRIMADSCPGMRTDISDEEIRVCVEKECP